MDKILNQLQDKVYELEGLLMLALSREDKRDAICALIKSKIKEIDTIGNLLNNEVVWDEAETEEDEIMADMPESEAEEDKTMEFMPLADIEKDVAEGDMPEDEEEEVPEDENHPEVYDKEPERPKRSRRSPVFCINDRFRFRRELFHGSDEAFNDMLDKVSVMYDYDDAEAYFIGIKGMDPEDETVADFLDILKAYYEAN